MTETEWNESDDAVAMLKFALDRNDISSETQRHRMGYRFNSGVVASQCAFETGLHRFYLACCRNIWPLITDLASRNGVEIAERWLNGNATDAELKACDWHVEGAAFGIDYKTSPDELERWIAQVESIPHNQMLSIIWNTGSCAELDAYTILKRAAYFVHFVTMYPAITPKGLPPKNYHCFLSPDLLRQHISYAG